MKTDEMLLKVDSWRIKIENRDGMITQAFEPAWEKVNNSVRIYKNRGGPVTLQLRTRTPLTRSGRGKLRHMLAHVELTTDEAKELIRALTTMIAECQG
ncbi:MAG TPA: hypothetical protein PKA28_10975 [Methylomusa anaerophila]|uniref:Uncharacterized protein n=1 Tax=Methylomusa anaerophila TaxID=1930071 RepID=A0A348AJ33_9FIRM|nr:hypothetical protein [Methylomusa anaerophila]BBB91081.1 hypothetical protein MAMMFC1_01749 [Methylomusa anaerophila]HML88958.1 hypothetical protein [Methylomusa anaerophila]